MYVQYNYVYTNVLLFGAIVLFLVAKISKVIVKIFKIVVVFILLYWWRVI